MSVALIGRMNAKRNRLATRIARGIGREREWLENSSVETGLTQGVGGGRSKKGVPRHSLGLLTYDVTSVIHRNPILVCFKYKKEFT